MGSSITTSAGPKEALDLSLTQLVEHIPITDSNGARTRGIDHGIHWALLQRFGPDSCYSGGMMCFNEDNTNSATLGTRVGYSETNSGTDIRTYHPLAVNVLPMPDELRADWDSSLDTGTGNHIHPVWMSDADRSVPIGEVGGSGFIYGEVLFQSVSGASGEYRYESDGNIYFKHTSGTWDQTQIIGTTTTSSTTPTGPVVTETPHTYAWPQPGLTMKNSETNLVGSIKTDNIAYRVWHGVFGTGDYDPGDPPKFNWVRGRADNANQVFWSTTELTSFVDSDHGLTGTQFRRDPMSFEWTGYGGVGNQVEFYEISSAPKLPQALFFQAVMNLDKTVGWSVNSLFSQEGTEASDFETYLDDMGTHRIGNWLHAVGHRANELGQKPTAIVWLMHGINDAASGVSKSAYKSATKRIITKMRAAWADAGWESGRLYFYICPGHVSDASREVYLKQYRAAAKEIAAEDSNALGVDMNELTDAAELAAVGMPRWDSSGTDEAHLDENSSDSDNSYSILMDRILDAVTAAAVLVGGAFGRRRRRGIRKTKHFIGG